jgi:hypothetical protein
MISSRGNRPPGPRQTGGARIHGSLQQVTIVIHVAAKFQVRKQQSRPIGAVGGIKISCRPDGEQLFIVKNKLLTIN